jgi:hypothetical protein
LIQTGAGFPKFRKPGFEQWNWGVHQSEIKEETEGRGTFAAVYTPGPLRARAVPLGLRRESEFFSNPRPAKK